MAADEEIGLDDAAMFPPRLYLIDRIEWNGELEWALLGSWLKIVANEAADWTDDPSLFPTLTTDEFREWFDIQLFLDVDDAGSGWIRRSRR